MLIYIPSLVFCFILFFFPPHTRSAMFNNSCFLKSLCSRASCKLTKILLLQPLKYRYWFIGMYHHVLLPSPCEILFWDMVLPTFPCHPWVCRSLFLSLQSTWGYKYALLCSVWSTSPNSFFSFPKCPKAVMKFFQFWQPLIISLC